MYQKVKGTIKIDLHVVLALKIRWSQMRFMIDMAAQIIIIVTV